MFTSGKYLTLWVCVSVHINEYLHQPDAQILSHFLKGIIQGWMSQWLGVFVALPEDLG